MPITCIGSSLYGNVGAFGFGGAVAAWPNQVCTIRELTRLLHDCKALEHEYCI